MNLFQYSRDARHGGITDLQPLSFTIKRFVVYTARRYQRRPLGSVVEHSLHTRGVNGSNPLAGTIFFNNLRATPSRPFWSAHTFTHTLKSRSVIKSHKIDLF